MHASVTGTITRKKNLNELINKILDIAAGYSRNTAAEMIAKLLDEQATVNRIVPQIKVTEAPGIPSDVTFTPAAIGTRKLDGKIYTIFNEIYTIFNVDGAGIFLKPHEDGRTLSDDEIKATLDKWNQEAREVIDEIRAQENDPYGHE